MAMHRKGYRVAFPNCLWVLYSLPVVPGYWSQALGSDSKLTESDPIVIPDTEPGRCVANVFKDRR
jgi:hypothetical protein